MPGLPAGQECDRETNSKTRDTCGARDQRRDAGHRHTASNRTTRLGNDRAASRGTATPRAQDMQAQDPDEQMDSDRLAREWQGQRECDRWSDRRMRDNRRRNIGKRGRGVERRRLHSVAHSNPHSYPESSRPQRHRSTSNHRGAGATTHSHPSNTGATAISHSYPRTHSHEHIAGATTHIHQHSAGAT